MSIFLESEWKKGVFLGTTHRYYAHKASAGKPTLLLLHGFPFGPLTFKLVLPLLRQRGYGIIIPELVGYGESDRPTDLAAYGRKKLSDELIAILDKEDIQKAIVLGHDHGAPLASTFVRIYPERSAGLVLVCVSYMPPSPTGMDVDGLNAMLEPILGYEPFGYWKTFLAPHAQRLLEEHLDSLITTQYSKDPTILIEKVCPVGAAETNLLADDLPEPFVSRDVIEEAMSYIRSFGLAGPLQWYHAAASATVNYEIESSLPPRLTLPYLFLGAKLDAVCPAGLSVVQAQWCDDLSSQVFDAGHWVMDSHPEPVVQAIDEWVEQKGL